MAGFWLLQSSLLKAEEANILDDVTMRIIEDGQNIKYRIKIPGRDVNWEKMLKTNGLTQQEYEDRREVFLEYQQDIILENEIVPAENIDTIREQE